MNKVIILKGLPGSGKSTWAKQMLEKYPGQYKRVNKDDLRAMLDNTIWSKKNEQFVLKIRNSIILAALEDGADVIVDDTNLHPKHERAIRELVQGKAEIEIKFFHCDLLTCIARNANRPHPVSEGVIRGMYNRFLKPNST